MSVKTATVIGATGLIGGHLVQQLQLDPQVETIRVLVRRPVQIGGPKIVFKLIDFNDTESYKLGIDGSDVVFCAVGTTQKKVKGDREAYYKVDYDIPVRAARFCKEVQCFNFVFVSSIGADPHSKNFYLKLKGDVEEAIKDLKIPSTSAFRPSLLLGERKEHRAGEQFAQAGAQVFSFAMLGKLRKYKPIQASQVAKAMVHAAKNGLFGFHPYEYDQILNLAKST
jgi:uncharacterized protein YbjT (DUF2867 family)